jgi:hypothetical protein
VKDAAVERFFDLLKGGIRPAEAMSEAQLSDDQIDTVVAIFSEALDGEHFTTSNYDFAIARRLGKLEESLTARDEFIAHELRNLAKTHLELIKAVNRLVDAQRAPVLSITVGDNVVPFPTQPKAG